MYISLERGVEERVFFKTTSNEVLMNEFKKQYSAANVVHMHEKFPLTGEEKSKIIMLFSLYFLNKKKG